MRKLLFFLPVGIAALMLVSCEALETPAQEQPSVKDPVVFTASIGDYTKVSETAFDEGDQVGISASLPIGASNVLYSYSNGALVSEEPIRWADSGEGPVTFTAVYPFSPDRDPAVPFSWTVDADQRNGYSYSDLVVAQAVASSGVVALPFRHALSRVIIKVAGTADQVPVEVTLTDVEVTATVDIPAGETSPSKFLEPVQAFRYSEDVWMAIIAPGEFATSVQVVTSSGELITLEIEEPRYLNAGEQILANVVLPGGQVEPSDVTFSCTVEPWTDAGSAYFGDNTGEDYPEHRVFLRKCFSDYVSYRNEDTELDYIGGGAYEGAVTFYGMDYCYIMMDTPGYPNFMMARGYDSQDGFQYPQFTNNFANASTTIYYMIVPFPCYATVNYDSLQELISLWIHWSDTWEKVGTATISGNMLSHLNIPAFEREVPLTLRRNTLDDRFYCIEGAFFYVEGLKRGSQILLYVSGEEARMLPSSAGIDYEYWPEELPGQESPVMLEASGGTFDGTVVHFDESTISDRNYSGSYSIPACDITFDITNQ